MDDPKIALQEHLDKSAIDSKKMIAGGFSILCIFLIWLGSLLGIFLKPEKAGDFYSLATLIVSTVSLITLTVIGAESVGHWRAMKTMETLDTNDKEENLKK